MNLRAVFIATAALGLVIAGCKSGGDTPTEKPNPPVVDKPTDRVLASIGPDDITISQIEPLLIEGYGLNVLLKYVQLDLARQQAAKQHIVVTAADVQHERDVTMAAIIRKAEDQSVGVGASTTRAAEDFKLSPQEADQLLDRALSMQQVSRAEFDTVILEMQATLRKLAEPVVAPKITDDAVRAYFNETYGGKASVRYIVSSNMQDAQKVEQVLSAGKSFDEAALAIGQQAREFPPFTKLDDRVPQVIRDVTFTLKPGGTSDPVQVSDQAGTRQYILVLKLMDLAPPQHARFEDYADSARQEYHDQQLNIAMKEIYTNLGKMALEYLRITDPVLKKQWDARQAQNAAQTADNEGLRKQLDELRASQPPATVPSEPNPFTTAPSTRDLQEPGTQPAQ